MGNEDLEDEVWYSMDLETVPRIFRKIIIKGKNTTKTLEIDYGLFNDLRSWFPDNYSEVLFVIDPKETKLENQVLYSINKDEIDSSEVTSEESILWKVSDGSKVKIRYE